MGAYNMIFRRFMQHVTDQNWFVVAMDVIVVIMEDGACEPNPTGKPAG